MQVTKRRTSRGYALAALTVSATVALKSLVDHTVGPGPPLIFFFLPVMLTAWYGGLRPGVIATALSSLACTALFLHPIGSLRITSGNDVFRLVIFVTAGLLISGLMGSLHTASDAARHRLERVMEQDVALREGGERLRRTNTDLMWAYDATIEGWARALDLRDKETEGHSRRVTEMTVRLAREMGLDAEELVHVRRGALLHDVGKLGIPDTILLKPGPLTDDEWEVMRRHPAYAREWLAPIPYLRPALDIPYCHHEKWDGTGYPQGLRDEQIPLAARIFAAVDIWDALRSDRPYRLGWPDERVIEHLRSLAGVHLDPRVVETFLGVLVAGGAPAGHASGTEGKASMPPLDVLQEELNRIAEQNRCLELEGEELRQAVARLTELAETDDLTGSKNRRHFREALEAAYSLAVRKDQPLALALLDVDGFKAYNDAHGHQAGDEALRTVSRIIREQVRAYDVVARLGGDEFALLMPTTARGDATIVAERVRAAVAGSAWLLRPVTVSLGVATLTPSVLSSGQLMEEADSALYYAKDQGRDKVEDHPMWMPDSEGKPGKR